ncbi:sensor domain-containing protein [Mycobacterium sp. NPDC051198]
MRRGACWATVCCFTLLVPACTTRTDATTGPKGVDLSVVSVEDLRSISGIPEFHEILDAERTAPAAYPDIPEPCLAVYDEPTVFGTDWRQFRRVVHSATIDDPFIPPIVDIVQTIAVYPDEAHAQATFNRLQNAVPRCAAAKFDYFSKTPQRPDSSTMVFEGDDSSGIYRVAQSTVIYVSAIGPYDTADVGLRVADQLTSQRR